MDDVTTRDQGLMLGQVTITHLADTLEQLDQDTETLVSIGQGRGCQISTLKYQQEDGLNTVLPYGLQRVEAMRSLTTESTAVLMPFKAQEIQDKQIYLEIYLRLGQQASAHFQRGGLVSCNSPLRSHRLPPAPH